MLLDYKIRLITQEKYNENFIKKQANQGQAYSKCGKYFITARRRHQYIRGHVRSHFGEHGWHPLSNNIKSRFEDNTQESPNNSTCQQPETLWQVPAAHDHYIRHSQNGASKVKRILNKPSGRDGYD